MTITLFYFVHTRSSPINFVKDVRFSAGVVFLYADGKPRIFVSGISEGSVADVDGRIKVNDQIIAVNFHLICFGLIRNSFSLKLDIYCFSLNI